MEALDLALARQEALAAAHSSNPLARTIMLRLAAHVLEKGAKPQEPNRTP